MKIEKLPSGSYRIRKMYKGKTYQIVTDYKPTQKEAIQLMAEELNKVTGKEKGMTFRDAAGEYIKSKRNVLSPSTICGYNAVINRISDAFMDMEINDIGQVDIQREINRVAADRSPKTVYNHHGFITAVLGVFRPDMRITTTLPQKRRIEPYIPSDEDVKRVLEYAKGTEFEIPIKLACYGMRRSEICALTYRDVEGDVVHITKAIVPGENKEWVIKSTKTTESTRDIVIPEELAEKIVSEHWEYQGNPGRITSFLTKAQKKLDIPRFSTHKLRHYFASKMSAMHVPDADIMKMGGWRTDRVMKTVYRHAMQDRDKEAQRDAARKLRDAIF